MLLPYGFHRSGPPHGGAGSLDVSYRQLIFSSAGSTGSARMRFPTAAKIPLQIAGAIGGTPGSPTPPGGALLATM